MTEIVFYKDGKHNQCIREIIENGFEVADCFKVVDGMMKKMSEVIPYLFYKSYYRDNREIKYVNAIMKKILQEPYFNWCDEIQSNAFGKSQYYKNHEFKFEKIPDRNNCINHIADGIFPYKNIGILNVWVVIVNPENLKLNQLVDNIELTIGGNLYHRYKTKNIENEINILAYIFKVESIQYKDGKIYIPLILPYNNLLLNNIYHEIYIFLMYKTQHIKFEVWCNICDMNVFPQLSNTDNNNHEKFSLISHQIQFTGTEKLTIYLNKIKLYFKYQSYGLYIMNISRENVNSIKLNLNSHLNGMQIEYELNDIEWFSNHVIIWFNRNFLLVNQSDNNINFTCCDAFLVIENKYTEEQNIDITSISYNSMYHGHGLMSPKYYSVL
jgi:hypothetical protein